MTDILWHDIDDVHEKTAQGLIRAQAEIYFFGDKSRSHTVADVGGEFATASQSSTSWVSYSWFIPTLDIIATYREMGILVQEEDLGRGMTENWADVQLTSLVWKLADPVIQRITPFLQEDMPYYFVGGLDDSAQWSARCWKNFISWLENGSDLRRLCLVEPPTTVSSTSQKRSNSKLVHAHSTIRSLPSFAALRTALMAFIVSRPSADGKGIIVTLDRPEAEVISYLNQDLWNSLVRDILKASIPPHLHDILKTALIHVSATSKGEECSKTTDMPNLLRISSDVFFANLGESLAYGDFNGDKKMEIAMGAPGYTPSNGLQQSGAVFVLDIPSSLHGQHTLLASHADPSTFSLIGSVRSGRFGSSMTVLDLNRDGYDDLVVSEPRFGNEQLVYRGRVFVYYGSSKGLSKDSYSVIALSQSIGNFTMMGTSLSSGDLDGDGFDDLIIGSPLSCRLDAPCDHLSPEAKLQSGAVSIFLTSLWTSNSTIQLTDADITLQGASRYSWFGSQAIPVVSKAAGGIPALIVSSPIGAYTNTLQAPGSVYSYQWSIPGPKNAKRGPRTAPVPVSSMTTGEASSKLGWSISLGNPYSKSKSPQLAAISAPTRSVTRTGDSDLWAAGRVYLTLATLTGTSIENSSIATISGSESLGRFGWSTVLGDFDVDGFDDLVVSAPFEADQSGRIYYWSGGSSFPQSHTTSSSRDMCLELPQTSNPASRSRFGHTMLPVGPSRAGPRLLAVSSPRDAILQQEGGSVFILSIQ